MNMIEKVARALYPQYEWALTAGHKDLMHDTARRAIDAMREPSDAMMNIYYELNHKAGPRATFDVSTWERSIDAALKDS